MGIGRGGKGRGRDVLNLGLPALKPCFATPRHLGARGRLRPRRRPGAAGTSAPRRRPGPVRARHGPRRARGKRGVRGPGVRCRKPRLASPEVLLCDTSAPWAPARRGARATSHHLAPAEWSGRDGVCGDPGWGVGGGRPGARCLKPGLSSLEAMLCDTSTPRHLGAHGTRGPRNLSPPLLPQAWRGAG